jgi:hypothetical protein
MNVKKVSALNSNSKTESKIVEHLLDVAVCIKVKASSYCSDMSITFRRII